jgi:hypothetical protein
MRLGQVRRLPIAFGWLTKWGDAATAQWMKPILTRPEIRRHAVRTLRAAASDTDFLLAAAERLPTVDRPALGEREPRDATRTRPPPRRPSPQGRLVEVDDSYTLIPLDQPTRLAQTIREFTRVPRPRHREPAAGDPGRRTPPACRRWSAVVRPRGYCSAIRWPP